MSSKQESDPRVFDFMGYSMYPALKPGDQLIVKPVQEFIIGDIVVFNHGGRSITHRFVERNGDILTFLGDRLKHPEKVSLSQVTGKVMLVIRNGKTFDPPGRSRFALLYRIGLTIYFKIKNALLLAVKKKPTA